jgi:glycosyltransferase involved in cell wall biosynthesis
MESLTVSAVMPAYNESGRIAGAVEAVRPYVDEVLVIDDGSTDETAREAAEAGARVLRQAKNRGYLAAVKRGFAEAEGDVVVTVDADGEMPVERIPDLVRPIAEGRADMVQGRRERIVRPSEALLTRLARLKGPVGDSGTGFRALRTDLARRLELKGVCICGVFSLEVLSLGGRITEVPVRLRHVDKARRIAWYHARQIFYVLAWLFRRRAGKVG